MKAICSRGSITKICIIIFAVPLIVVITIWGYHFYRERCVLKKIHVLEAPVQIEFKMIQYNAEAVLNEYSESKDTREWRISLAQRAARLSALTELYSHWSNSDELPLPFGIDSKDWPILTHFCGALQNYTKLLIETETLSQADTSNLYGIITLMDECDTLGNYTPILELDQARIEALEITFLDTQIFTIDQ